jgi:cellulose synthase/poly-beta-1,6-N-acetylglucosamine synthase-like glycosyltransferase
MGETKKKVSVLIPMYNEQEELLVKNDIHDNTLAYNYFTEL